ncbi:MAG: type II toxin-antitoxin system HicB family antitoxin [Chloroflexota bacterium]
MKYAVVVERSPTGFAAYVPDLPGCVAAGGTRAEVERLIREAIQFHLDGLREQGEPIPEPTTGVELVEV